MNGLQNSLILLVIAPLFVAAFLIPLLGPKNKSIPIGLSLAGITIAGIAAYILAFFIFYQGRISYNIGSWGLPWGIELVGDYLSISLVITVACIGFWAVVYSTKYIEQLVPKARNQQFYYCLLCLALGSMMAFLLAGDLFTMFVYLSVFSLAGVALIAISEEEQAVWAALRYLLLSTASGVLIFMGIVLLYYFTGTVNIAELNQRLGNFIHNKSVLTALVFLAVGFSVKAALFPLHVWMPDAHAFAPSPVSAILSGLMIEMGAYGMVRSVFFFLHLNGGATGGAINLILCWLAAAAIIYGAIAACFQQDLKLIFAYSSVSQIGYIVLGISLSSHFGLLGGLLHIVNHAVIKSVLFFCAGAFFYKTGWRTLKELEGVGKKMPFTAGALVLAGISIIGIPPAGGFVSEWYICLGAIQSKQMIFAIIVLLGSLLSSIYYIKIISALYFKQPAGVVGDVVMDEAPLSILMPIWVLALTSMGLGIFNRLPVLWMEKAVKGILGG